MIKKLVVFWCAAVLISVAVTSEVTADHHGKIRIHKLNKKGQVVQARWSKRLTVKQCENLKKTREIFRFGQIGYEYCSLFSAKDCQQESLVLAMWGEGNYRVKGVQLDTSLPQPKLYRGSKWIIGRGGNITIQSIYCDY